MNMLEVPGESHRKYLVREDPQGSRGGYVTNTQSVDDDGWETEKKV